MWASLVSGLDLTLLIGNDPKSLYTKSNQQSDNHWAPWSWDISQVTDVSQETDITLKVQPPVFVRLFTKQPFLYDKH